MNAKPSLVPEEDMALLFTGALEFPSANETVLVEGFGFGSNSESARLRFRSSGDFEGAYAADIVLGSTTPNGNLLSLPFFPYPSESNLAVRIDIVRRKLTYLLDKKGAPHIYVVGYWIDVGKKKDEVSKFIGLLKGDQIDQPYIKEGQEWQILESLRVKASRT